MCVLALTINPDRSPRRDRLDVGARVRLAGAACCRFGVAHAWGPGLLSALTLASCACVAVERRRRVREGQLHRHADALDDQRLHC